jgi:RNA polymerase sigma-70 factor (ECF subfamily)
VSTGDSLEGLLRELAPQVLAALVRHYGNFESAEDAVQEALLAAATQWPGDGVPDRPAGWLITVAARRMTDRLRSEQASRQREEKLAAAIPPGELVAPAADAAGAGAQDDTLILLLLCCHPSLTPPSQVALTLRAVGGLTTAEIARAFLVPEPTMAQRISRARARVRASGAAFELPAEHERADRLAALRHVLYLSFNEGYTATSGPDLHRPDLTAEAIRLTRLVRDLMPADGEVVGLLALMLLTEARRPARVSASGELVTLDEQDRGAWDRGLIREGHALVRARLASGQAPGRYQILAAINAVHTDARDIRDTDWSQIVALYDQLVRVDPSPVVRLNRAIAVAELDGPDVALAQIDGLPLDGYHVFHAARADLLRRLGLSEQARAAYDRAIDLAGNTAETAYLKRRRDQLAGA